MNTFRDRRVDLVLLGVAVVWGSSYLVVKQLTTSVFTAAGPTSASGVLPVLAMRYTGAAVALIVVVAVGRRRLGMAEVGAGVFLGFTQAAVLALETYGVAGTSATNAGLLISSTILLTPLVECIVRRSWLPPAFFGAATLSFAGMGLLIAHGGLHAPTAGDLLVLAAAFVRACHVTALGRITASRPLDLLGLTLVQSVVGSVLFTALDPAGFAATLASADGSQWFGFAYLAVVCSVFAFLAQSWAVRSTSASRAGLLLGTEPIWAVVIALAVGGESLGPAGAVGAVSILAGIWWGQRVERRARVPTVASVSPRPAVPRGRRSRA
ncbi:MAG: DMT family transporter [Janthinobacterium lividum]